MYIAFLNPQGNFDRNDSYWTEHPDFGGQLVYVKEIAIAMAKQGHKVDIITRRFNDPKFNAFSDPFDHYPNHDNLRIVRIHCGPDVFLKKEALWEHLHEWTDRILDFFKAQNQYPDFATGHYGDGGLACVMLKQKASIPYSFTGHSLGAQKLEKLGANPQNIQLLDDKYRFSKRIAAERTAMTYADLIFVSTEQERDEQYSHLMYKDVTHSMTYRFVVAPPGANTEVFNTDTHASDHMFIEKFDNILQRDILPTRKNLPYVVLASRLDPKKNHVGLIRAYAKDKLLQKRCNIAISLRGIENAYDDYSFAKPDELAILNEIMQIIRTYHLEGAVTFISINSQKELAAFYRYMANKQSLFALTALYEPFGLAPIEAMISGLPAVVTKYGGPSDVLQEGDKRFGVLVDVFDEPSIAKGIHECFDHYQTYRKHGIQRVLDKYTWDSTAKTYLQSIKRTLANNHILDTVNIPTYFLDQKQPILLDFIITKLKEME